MYFDIQDKDSALSLIAKSRPISLGWCLYSLAVYTGLAVTNGQSTSTPLVAPLVLSMTASENTTKTDSGSSSELADSSQDDDLSGIWLDAQSSSVSSSSWASAITHRKSRTLEAN